MELHNFYLFVWQKPTYYYRMYTPYRFTNLKPGVFVFALAI